VAENQGLGTIRERPGARQASRLLRRILVANHEIEKQLGRELEVNPTDLDAMQHLIGSGSLSPSDIADRLGISTAAVTIAIDRLVKIGHVTREPHPTDRRRLLVVPNAASVARAMGALMPMIRETDALLDAYTEAEQSVITDYLSRALDVLQRRVEHGLVDHDSGSDQ
jgi:DNA-binding MarR family transcriptional regulator